VMTAAHCAPRGLALCWSKTVMLNTTLVLKLGAYQTERV